MNGAPPVPTPVHTSPAMPAVEALRETDRSFPIPAHRIEFERTIAAIRAQLNETTFTTAWAEGRGMTLEQAIVYALEGTRANVEDQDRGAIS